MCTRVALNKDDEIIGYEFVNLGKMMEAIKKGVDANEALENAKSSLRPVGQRRQVHRSPSGIREGGIANGSV